MFENVLIQLGISVLGGLIVFAIEPIIRNVSVSLRLKMFFRAVFALFYGYGLAVAAAYLTAHALIPETEPVSNAAIIAIFSLPITVYLCWRFFGAYGPFAD